MRGRPTLSQRLMTLMTHHGGTKTRRLILAYDPAVRDDPWTVEFADLSDRRILAIRTGRTLERTLMDVQAVVLEVTP